jgi:hypothetical protein
MHLSRYWDKGWGPYRSGSNWAMLRGEWDLSWRRKWNTFLQAAAFFDIKQTKPNLGHSEGAAAITGILKAVVSLENRTILPNIKFKTPNPRSMSSLHLYGSTQMYFDTNSFSSVGKA